MNAFGILQSLNSWYGILIMGLLAGLSVYLFALVWVRFNFFKKMDIKSEEIIEETHEAIKKGDVKTLVALKNFRPTASNQLVSLAIGFDYRGFQCVSGSSANGNDSGIGGDTGASLTLRDLHGTN